MKGKHLCQFLFINASIRERLFQFLIARSLFKAAVCVSCSSVKTICQSLARPVYPLWSLQCFLNRSSIVSPVEPI